MQVFLALHSPSSQLQVTYDKYRLSGDHLALNNDLLHTYSHVQKRQTGSMQKLMPKMTTVLEPFHHF